MKTRTPKKRTPGEKKPSIALGLAVAAAVAPGHRWKLQDLAELCGCTWQNLGQLEARALRKLRLTAARRGLLDELRSGAR